MSGEMLLKVSLFTLLNLQGISSERAEKETNALADSLRKIPLNIISEKHSEPGFPSFRKLTSLSAQSGTQYFFWGSLRQSGEKSYINLYLYDVSKSRKIKDFSMKCSLEFCSEEQFETMMNEIKSELKRQNL